LSPLERTHPPVEKNQELITSLVETNDGAAASLVFKSLFTLCSAFCAATHAASTAYAENCSMGMRPRKI
jgi:hypothetical protein